MKFFFQILFLLLTWFTNLNARPVFTKVVLPSYEVSFSKTKNAKVESTIKIWEQNYAGSGIENESQFSSILNGEVWTRVACFEEEVKVVSGAGSLLDNTLIAELKALLGPKVDIDKLMWVVKKY